MAKILVIDDDPMVRTTIGRILRHGGHEPILAENGVRGVELFSKEHPDLVITDIIMPEKDGIETIREIHGLCPDARIVALSGGARIGNLDFLGMAMKLGACAMIDKPFGADELCAVISRCLPSGGRATPELALAATS